MLLNKTEGGTEKTLEEIVAEHFSHLIKHSSSRSRNLKISINPSTRQRKEKREQHYNKTNISRGGNL
jgi:hypothetical protein